MTLKQSSSLRPLMRKPVVSRNIACRTRYHNIPGCIRSSFTCQRDNVVNMILCQFDSTPVTFSFLRPHLPLDILRCKCPSHFICNSSSFVRMCILLQPSFRVISLFPVIVFPVSCIICDFPCVVGCIADTSIFPLPSIAFVPVKVFVFVVVAFKLHSCAIFTEWLEFTLGFNLIAKELTGTRVLLLTSRTNLFAFILLCMDINALFAYTPLAFFSEPVRRSSSPSRRIEVLLGYGERVVAADTTLCLYPLWDIYNSGILWQAPVLNVGFIRTAIAYFAKIAQSIFMSLISVKVLFSCRINYSATFAGFWWYTISHELVRSISSRRGMVVTSFRQHAYSLIIPSCLASSLIAIRNTSAWLILGDRVVLKRFTRASRILLSSSSKRTVVAFFGLVAILLLSMLYIAYQNSKVVKWMEVVKI